MDIHQSVCIEGFEEKQKREKGGKAPLSRTVVPLAEEAGTKERGTRSGGAGSVTLHTLRDGTLLTAPLKSSLALRASPLFSLRRSGKPAPGCSALFPSHAAPPP